MYRIEYRPGARRQLARLPRAEATRIVVVIEGLAVEPRPLGCRKVTGTKDVYRLRVGRYRLVYQVREREVLLLVIRIGPRNERTYRGL